MIALFGIAILAGVVAGISPCVLPVLPVLFATGLSDGTSRSRLRRPLSVIAGLIVSFTTFTLVGSELLSLAHLSQDLLRNVGLILLGAVGLGLLLPPIYRALSLPFERMRIPHVSRETPGLVVGISLGAVFVPCAGPVLTAITVVAATHHVGVESVVLTLCFALGASVPLLFVALAGREIATRSRILRERATWLRGVGGALMLGMSVLLATGALSGLQRAVPGYTSVLQRHLEASSFATRQLSALAVGRTSPPLPSICHTDAPALEACGEAASFTGINTWLNTPGDRPLSLASLRGKIVLIDFWTYSCINCQRALPHVEAWYSRYHRAGLDVIGVHTPEFAFEHVVSNVAAAAHQLHVMYPIAIDNNYATWNAYSNAGWPAQYLLDQHGILRHYSYGEGDYATTERLIRELLVAAHPGIHLPAPSDLPDLTPTEATTPETYLGYDRVVGLDASIQKDRLASYAMPRELPMGYFGLSGSWNVHAEEITAGVNAGLTYPVTAKDVYLVLSGAGNITVTVNNGRPSKITVSGVPRLYTLTSSSHALHEVIRLTFTPGIRAYDFTFG